MNEGRVRDCQYACGRHLPLEPRTAVGSRGTVGPFSHWERNSSTAQNSDATKIPGYSVPAVNQLAGGTNPSGMRAHANSGCSSGSELTGTAMILD